MIEDFLRRAFKPIAAFDKTAISPRGSTDEPSL
jgi:hypothetical protein